jgi:hypothetical protein
LASLPTAVITFALNAFARRIDAAGGARYEKGFTRLQLSPFDQREIGSSEPSNRAAYQ